MFWEAEGVGTVDDGAAPVDAVTVFMDYDCAKRFGMALRGRTAHGLSYVLVCACCLPASVALTSRGVFGITALQVLLQERNARPTPPVVDHRVGEWLRV